MNTSRAIGAVASAALTASALVVMGPSTAARADGCLRTVGDTRNIDTYAGYHIGVFYQGYNQCTRQAYAEIDFSDMWVSQVADGWDIYMTSNGRNEVTDTTPGGKVSWVSPMMSIDTPGTNESDFEAHFVLTWNGYECKGYSKWNYTNGTSNGAWVGGPNCNPWA
ncbi:hypothetical protein ABT072_44085 [Streptomyces sp. NPDC002589]|uniref:hypothetical protein n=1 Tax=Streptomyces sp. NPDC002589 TaxID=3154420 RepID=UPI00331ACD02